MGGGGRGSTRCDGQREKERGGQMKEVPSTGGKTLWGGMFMDAA